MRGMKGLRMQMRMKMLVEMAGEQQRRWITHGGTVDSAVEAVDGAAEDEDVAVVVDAVTKTDRTTTTITIPTMAGEETRTRSLQTRISRQQLHLTQRPPTSLPYPVGKTRTRLRPRPRRRDQPCLAGILTPRVSRRGHGRIKWSLQAQLSRIRSSSRRHRLPMKQAHTHFTALLCSDAPVIFYFFCLFLADALLLFYCILRFPFLIRVCFVWPGCCVRLPFLYAYLHD